MKILDFMSKDKNCPYEQDYTIFKEKVGTTEEQAKALHYMIDWMKAVCKRPDDNRTNSKFSILEILKSIQKGSPLTENFDTHYEGE